MKKFVQILVLILFASFQKVEAQTFNFRHYSIEDGLSQSVVNCMMVDDEGYFWFGTQNGLNRFDGYRFKKYVNIPDDTTSISDNWIFAIVQDSKKNMWFATKLGLNRFDKQSGTFIRVDYKSDEIKKLIKNDVVYGLEISDNDDIIINTPPYITIYDPFSGQKIHYKTGFTYTGTIFDQTFPIFKDSRGIVWIGSADGLSFIRKGNSAVEQFKLPAPEGANNNSVSAIFEDSNGRLWIGRQKGINILKYNGSGYYLISSDKINSLLNFSFVRSINQGRDGKIWIGTEGNGLFYLKLNSDAIGDAETFNYRAVAGKTNSLSHDIILSQWIDKSDLLWIGTLQGIDCIDLKPKKFGIIRKTQEQFSTDLLDNVIASLYKEGNDLWIGNWGKGLNILNLKTGKVSKYTYESNGINHIPDNFVHVIFKDNENRIWIGTRQGISIFDRNSKKFIPIKRYFPINDFPDFSDVRIFCILQDRKFNYWIGTSKGLFEINLKANQIKRFNAESEPEYRLASNLVYSLLEDYQGHIWIGTNDGLDEYYPENNSLKHFVRSETRKNSLCDNYVVSLCEDNHYNLWIGTKNGVNKFSKGDSTFTYFSADSGLPGNLVYSILLDKNNDIWFTTGNGVARYNNKTKDFRNYDIEDGLQSLEFNLNATFKAEDGYIYLGGMKGVNFFHPDSLSDNQIVPTIVISNVEIINKRGQRNVEIGKQKEIILRYDDFAFNIEFSVLEFTNPEKNQYAYMFQGVNEEWIHIGNRRFVSFSDIKEGQYILKIKGSNNDGVWNETGINIKIIKKPPWWRTIYAYIIYFLFLILIILVIIRLRINSLIRERKRLEILVQSRTKEIQKQKDEIAAQRDEIESQRDYTAFQRDKLKQMNDSLTDSINYAKRIQTAILPSKELLNRLFRESFVLYIPKQIISGDFYWVKEILINKKRRIYFAVADCTGHGVPGGFVSMLGITLLNDIVSDKNNYLPAEILNQLREQVKSSFNQSWDNKGSKDGMDISLCMIEEKSKQLFYAGANSRIHVIHNNTLLEIAGDKMPVGIYYVEKPFTNHQLDLSDNDIIYIYSDGYQDQCGGAKGLKFMRNSFARLLNDIKDYPLDKQNEILLKTLNEWQNKHEQVDDITLAGIRL